MQLFWVTTINREKKIGKGKGFCIIWVMFDLQDSLVETAKEEASSISNIIVQATKWEYSKLQANDIWDGSPVCC